MLRVVDIAHAFWPRGYWLLARLDPLIEPVWRRFGIGNVVRVVIPGRRTGLPRALFLGVLSVGDNVYIGHPDGPCGWTDNLDAAGGCEVEWHDGARDRLVAIPLSPGDERDAVLRATFQQHPFPGGTLYWLFRGRLRAVGRYYRLEPATGAASGEASARG